MFFAFGISWWFIHALYTTLRANIKLLKLVKLYKINNQTI